MAWGATEWVLISLLVVILLVLCALFALLLYYYWKRHVRHKPPGAAAAQRAGRRPADIAVAATAVQPQHRRATRWPGHITRRPIMLDDFGARLRQVLKDDRLLLRAEFDDINEMAADVKFGTVRLSPTIVSDQNLAKNRFIDVLPSETNRVKLRQCRSDYINASHVEGAVLYIAAQGPMDTAEALLYGKTPTVDDFWLMIWQQNVQKIVNLTNCEEKLRKKSSVYWPERTDRPLMFGAILVKLVQAVQHGDFVLRTLLVCKEEETRTVRHWHCTQWSDYGSMEPAKLINLRHSVHHDQWAEAATSGPAQGHRDRRPPIVVHCSAGVGRTGTFIALDTIAHRLESGAREVDIMHTVHTLRRQRARMVQTLDQYTMVYQCVGLLVEQLGRGSAQGSTAPPALGVPSPIEPTAGHSSIASAATSAYDNPTLVDSSGATTDSDVTEMNI